MKMMKIKVNEIIALHNEIVGHLKQSLEKAIQIGELLTEQKQSLKHGEFTKWVKENLPFTDRTARNYMRLHRERNRLKTETVSDLKGAYALLSEGKSSWVPHFTLCFAETVNTAREEVESWEEAFKLIAEESEMPIWLLCEWHYHHFGDMGDEFVYSTIKGSERMSRKAKQEQTTDWFMKVYEDCQKKRKQGGINCQ